MLRSNLEEISTRMTQKYDQTTSHLDELDRRVLETGVQIRARAAKRYGRR